MPQPNDKHSPDCPETPTEGRPEEALRASEERFRLAVEAGHIGTCDWDYQTGEMYWNDERFQMYGMESQRRLMHYSDFLAAVYPEDRERVENELRSGIEERGEHQEEYRVLRPDGSVRWIFEKGCVVTWTAANQPLRVISVLFDITERKHTEEVLEARVQERTRELDEKTQELARSTQSLRELTRRLAAAQEDERQRLSREMHDQTGQSIAGLSLLLHALRDGIAPDGADFPLMDRVDAAVNDLARDIHRIAVELRPPAINDMGLVTALEDYILKWAAQTGIRAAFESTGMENVHLSALVEITIYRIVQESLNNVARHAAKPGSDRSTHSANVTIQPRHGGEVQVAIEDDGPGFDVEAAMLAGRLGIAGMRERAEAAGGTIEIESAPGDGATVYLRVPATNVLDQFVDHAV